ncbi:MAG TPA: hypothetical protein PKW79_00360 [Rhabdochlamydiaceae bacterium]|nr:hypothetical protein [Rhabdochlamydiaceae bacterium]
MSLEKYLDQFQRLVGKMVKTAADGEIDVLNKEPMRGYIADINLTIDAYVEVANRFHDEAKRWEFKITQLCRLRDQIQDLIDLAEKKGNQDAIQKSKDIQNA